MATVSHEHNGNGNYYEWDAAKADHNYIKHGITFSEAASAFDDAHAFLLDDSDHSLHERRELLVGYSAQNRLITVIFTEREHQRPRIIVRIISARRATKQERKQYEEAIT